jgi:hypothetical protein
MLSWAARRVELSAQGDNPDLPPMARVDALAELFFHLGNFDAQEKAKVVRRIQEIAETYKPKPARNA